MSDDNLLQLGNYTAAADLANVDTGKVTFNVSVAVGSPDELSGSDVAVALTAGSTALALLTGPDPNSPLPCVETRGITAFASFTFDNPNNLAVSRATVTVKGQTATLDLSPLVA